MIKTHADDIAIRRMKDVKSDWRNMKIDRNIVLNAAWVVLSVLGVSASVVALAFDLAAHIVCLFPDASFIRHALATVIMYGFSCILWKAAVPSLPLFRPRKRSDIDVHRVHMVMMAASLLLAMLSVPMIMAGLAVAAMSVKGVCW